MKHVTLILQQIEQGDVSTEELLPLIYNELRRLAAAQMANERSDHTLQPTALVHEAYLRLVDRDAVNGWDSRGHFFAAAAEAMRRILVERARAKKRNKREGENPHLNVNDVDPPDESQPELILAINDVLDHLAEEDSQLADLVKLRCYAGFSLPEVAKVLGIGQSTAYEHWAYAKSRLKVLLDPES